MPVQDEIANHASGVSLVPAGAASPASSSRAMQVLERTASHIAPTNIPILLTGESGTGKEFLAQQIHRLSFRRGAPLVKCICASFGEAGTVYSDSGTLFLKEISELDLASQRTLLYSLPAEEPVVAGARSGPRLISSTTVNLEQEMHAGRFRAELYYRINGVCLRLPPLRERKEDIPALAELLMIKHAGLRGHARPVLDAEDLRILQSFSWPGNIRELENVVKQIVALDDPKLVLSQLAAASNEAVVAVAAASAAAVAPPESKGSRLKAATRAASRRAERQLILDALARTRWNRKRAAQELQISYKSLLYKLKEIGMEESNGI